MNEEEVQRKRRDEEESSTQRRAQILGFSYLDTREFENEIPLVTDVLTKEEMHQNYILPLTKGNPEQPYEYMITSQTPRSVLQKIHDEHNKNAENVRYYLISQSAFKVFMLRYDPPVEQRFEDIKISNKGDSETFTAVSQTLNSVPSDKVFDFLLDQADRLGASDIHIESMQESIRVRMRIDGVLHPVADISKDRYRTIIGELSSRANISVASMKSQSGHLQKDIFVDGTSHTLNVRVETIPSMYGQDAVLRLFNFDASLLRLDLLGLSDKELSVINDVVSHPRGLVLVVGPTGSGKSTTLYSMLNALNTTERKIITLEDPIEYGINGISQIPINTDKGTSFAEGLRSVLRLDPDVVMVGEIRDADTARVAIQASITGHFVMSTFHANYAVTAFSRMIDLIGANPIFSNSIRLVIAQRLVRKLEKKEPYIPDETTLRYIKEKLQDVVPNDMDWSKIRLFKPVPTEENPFGYSGRMALMEQLVVTDKIQAFIRGDINDINEKDIEKVAKEEGMLTMEQKGLIACIKGETTLEEISRVI